MSEQKTGISRRSFIAASAGTAAASTMLSAGTRLPAARRRTRAEGMRVLIRAKDMSENALTYLKQIGVDDVMVYLPDIPGYKEKGHLVAEDLANVRKRLDQFGLKIATVQLGQGDLSRLLLGREGADAELDRVCRTIECVGKSGIPVMMYSLLASRVILTEKGGALPGYWDNPAGRGGARLKSFDEARAKAIKEEPVGRITADQMWERITRFLKRCVPVAAVSDVYLACHPDDPPIALHWGVEQVLFRLDALKRFIAIEPDKHNALLLCQGTIQEAGINVLDYIRYFGRQGRIVHVELRGVRGLAPKYDEVFMDEGELSLWDVVRTLKEVGYRGPVEVAHVPKMINDDNRYVANAWAVGFVKGMLSAAQR